jgi:hypothetical protein
VAGAVPIDLPHLREHGWTVVPGVVDPLQIAAALAALRDAGGVDLDDPATWAIEHMSPPVWGHQAQWDLRQDPRVHAAFAAAHGREDLNVTQEGFGFKPPLATTPGEPAAAMDMHFDLDPRTPRPALQGVLYLTDVAADQGAFCAVPGVFADRDGWLARHPEAGPEVDVDLEGHPIVPVPGRAGDLVIFDSRLPHGNGANRAAAPRVVQYLTMQPVGYWGEQPSDHAALYRSGRANPAQRWRPGWDGVQPGPPATLTPLGRRLVGLDPWPAA